MSPLPSAGKLKTRMHQTVHNSLTSMLVVTITMIISTIMTSTMHTVAKMAVISTTITLRAKSSQPLTKKKVKTATMQDGRETALAIKRSRRNTTNHTTITRAIIRTQITTTIIVIKLTLMMQINSHTTAVTKISIMTIMPMLSLKKLKIMEADYGRI